MEGPGNQSAQTLLLIDILFTLGSWRHSCLSYLSKKRTPPFNVEMFQSWKTMTKPLILVTLLAGALSGLLQGISGVGGPPLIIWTLQMNLDKASLRATSSLILGTYTSSSLISFLVIISLIGVSAMSQGIFLFLIKRQLVLSQWGEYLVLLVSSLLGLYLGNKVHDKVDVKVITKILLIFLLLGALSMMTIPWYLMWLSYLIVFILGALLFLPPNLFYMKKGSLEVKEPLRATDCDNSDQILEDIQRTTGFDNPKDSDDELVQMNIGDGENQTVEMIHSDHFNEERDLDREPAL